MKNCFYYFLLGLLLGMLIILGEIKFDFISNFPFFPTSSGYCNNDDRYTGHEHLGGGLQIPNNEACELVKNYLEVDSNAYFGGFLSKKVIDKIFDIDTLNGLSIYIGRDRNENVRYIVQGERADYASLAGAPVEGAQYYLIDANCPAVCGTMDLGLCGGRWPERY